ncbi:MAG: SsrA-binding protein [Elusimicrobia bacterium RIFCSPLOWO2_01_FULL_64_13]|nr:MAG: SsrA-binding protein [Elusimicrobia bacterium RIFCSPHIGHO2_01_FULL_64_10]OGR94479.1 MAG: SsrA-binding protein [Elusimicrobia bacterium RIFCSPLOWO2_01_FULL_64_13]
MTPERPDVKIIARNRKSREKFTILESFEAGIELLGYEVKSLRLGRISIDEGVVRIDRGQMLLMNVHIPPYNYSSHIEIDPVRTRRLLMHRDEIDRLEVQVRTKGAALIPLEIYFKKGYAKVSVGLGKGKKFRDRREEIKKRESERETRSRGRC